MEDAPNDKYSVDISGGVTDSQIAIGSQITQTKTVVPIKVIGEEGVAQLSAEIAEIRRLVDAQASPETRSEALRQVEQLEESVLSGAPKLSKLAAARSWFADHLPAIAGSVTSLVVHPLVGRLVGAAGDVMVAEFRRLFGVEPGSGSPKP